MADTKYLFAYGTLIDMFSAYGLFSRHVQQDTVEGTLYNVGFKFPGYVPEGEGKVHGTIYEIDANELILIDQYEGVPVLYHRGIATPDNFDHECVIYEYQMDNKIVPKYKLFPIEGGSWHEYLRSLNLTYD